MADFEFKKWIVDNGLQEIQDIFESHGATQHDGLQITSAPFQKVMQDHRLFAKPSLIPIVLNAVQQIATQNKIIISEQEEAVNNQIQQNIKTIEQIQKQTDILKTKYSQSIKQSKQQTLKQINAATAKISTIFKTLSDRVTVQQNKYLKQMNKLEEDVSNDQNPQHLNLVKDLATTIKEVTTYLNERQQQYDTLTSSNDDRKNRKNIVIKMGDEMKNEFDQKYERLTKHMKTINDCIAEHQSMKIIIDFVLNEKRYDKISKQIESIGQIINVRYDPSSENPHMPQFDHEDDTELEVAKQLINALKQSLNSEQTMNQNNQIAIQSLNDQLAIQNANVVRLNDANKSQKVSINAVTQQLTVERAKSAQLQKQIERIPEHEQKTMEHLQPINVNPTTTQILKLMTGTQYGLKIRKLSQNKYAAIQRLDYQPGIYYVNIFETDSNGRLIAQGNILNIPQPYNKNGGHNDIYVFNQTTIIASTCPSDTTASNLTSLFSVLKVNGLTVSLANQYNLKEPYIAHGADMCKIGNDRMILCDYDGRLKILKISQSSIADGKFYQMKNYERNSTILKLSDSKLVRLSEITRGRIEAAVISVNGMNVSEATPYIIKESEGKYGRSLARLSDSKCLAAFSTKAGTQSFISVLAVSGNRVIVERSYTYNTPITLSGWENSNKIWYVKGSEIGTVKVKENGIVFYKVTDSPGTIAQISGSEFIHINYSKLSFVLMNLK
eukprot:512938_1